MNEQELIKKPVGIRILRGLLIAFGLLLFNLIFVLGPYVAIWGGILAFITASLAFIVSGFTLITAYLFTLPISLSVPSLFLQHPIMMVLSGGVLIGLGGSLGAAFVWISKYLVTFTGKYLVWHVSVIRGDEHE